MEVTSLRYCLKRIFPPLSYPFRQEEIIWISYKKQGCYPPLATWLEIDRQSVYQRIFNNTERRAASTAPRFKEYPLEN
jgi:hypothetical protein